MTWRIPPVQHALEVSSDLTAISTRIYQTLAPENAARPYTVWQIVTATPEIQLASTPEDDDQVVQVDVYSDSQSQARAMISAACDACEQIGDVRYGPVPFFDELTKIHRWFLQVEIWNQR